jgi:hypothetical protein
MPRKISNSAVYDSTEERRPLATNRRQVRPKPIPIDKASLALELLNNQTRPVVNIVGTRHFHEDPKPLDKNYPIEIELQRIAMEAVPNKPPFQPLKIKSSVTDEMIEKYREEERRAIRQRGYNVPPDILADLEPYEEIPPEYYEMWNRAMKELQTELSEGIMLYDRAKKNVSIVMKQLKDLNDEYNSLAPLLRVREKAGDKKVYLEDEYIRKKQQLEHYLDTLQMDMRNLQEEKNMIEDRMEQMKKDRKEFEAGDLKEKRTNAQKIKNAEDQLRLLNNTLPISQMVGEPDEVYRQRLIALRVPVDNSRVDAQEARIYEHKLFKQNLKKLIDLPLYQVENIIKMLDMNDMERTYQLNEIFPKIETEFVKQFGRKPVLRDPVQTLTDFFVTILEAPLQAQEQSEAISALAEEQGVFTGEIDRRLVGLKKAEVLKLLKDAGLTKGKAAEFQKKTVKQLKTIYTEYLKRSKTQEEQTQETALQYLDRISKAKQREDEFVRAERKADEEERKAFIKEEKREEGVQAKIGKKETSNFQRTQAFLQAKIAEQERKQQKAEKEQRRQEEEYRKLIEAQQREEAKKQKGITKFMVAKKK